ncbi:unnamed protein product [Heligmosomoides polygyrus]|uniref:DDE_Tnp_1_7 domain-containing protein n=1 Tax=Heligmosomoides polygyrus TaxID=6339 RepID=A0A183F2I4_HELPZ|nr:unnamed protein product [Heligmosomoides polygyrus]
MSDSDWLQKVLPIWAALENLVDRDVVHSIDSVDKITGSGKDLKSRWAARYTIWIRSRSVMAAKGYLVHFMKN